MKNQFNLRFPAQPSAKMAYTPFNKNTSGHPKTQSAPTWLLVALLTLTVLTITTTATVLQIATQMKFSTYQAKPAPKVILTDNPRPCANPSCRW